MAISGEHYYVKFEHKSLEGGVAYLGRYNLVDADEPWNWQLLGGTMGYNPNNLTTLRYGYFSSPTVQTLIEKIPKVTFIDAEKHHKDEGSKLVIDFEDLAGTKVSRVWKEECCGEDAIKIQLEDGRLFGLHHFQDCCETVFIEDIDAPLSQLRGHVLISDESSNGPIERPGDVSEEWTFYRMTTEGGAVTIRFYGASNGYYSTEVDMHQIPNKDFGIAEDTEL